MSGAIPLLLLCAFVTWTGTLYPFLNSSPIMAWVLINPGYETPSLWTMVMKLRHVYCRKPGITKPVLNGTYTQRKAVFGGKKICIPRTGMKGEPARTGKISVRCSSVIGRFRCLQQSHPLEIRTSLSIDEYFYCLYTDLCLPFSSLFYCFVLNCLKVSLLKAGGSSAGNPRCNKTLLFAYFSLQCT